MQLFSSERRLRETRGARWAGAVLSFASFLITAQMAMAQTKLVIVVPQPPTQLLPLLPFHIGEDAGDFKREGIAIEWKVVNGDQNCLRAVLSGEGDVAFVGPPALFDGVANGAQIKNIGSPDPLPDFVLVLAKNEGNSLKDVAGKTVAISTPGGMPHLLPQMMFKKNGINDQDTKYVPIGFLSARLQAIAAGKVDASILDLLTGLRGERQGVVNIVTSVAEQFPEGIDYVYDVVTEDALRKPDSRKALLGLIRGMIQGARRVAADPDHTATVLYEKTNHDIDLDLLKAAIRRLDEMHVWGINGGVDRRSFDFTVSQYLEYKQISKPISYEEGVDPSLVKEALQQLGTK